MAIKHGVLDGVTNDADRTEAVWDGTFAPDAGTFDAARLPAVSGASALQLALYLQEPGDTAAISINDIHQGSLGDCFLLASIGELALRHPGAITAMIRSNGQGETVTLYTDRSGHVPGFSTTSFKPTTVSIDNAFPAACVNQGSTQGVVGSQKEIWPQVLEKAVATLDGGYGAIANGGNPVIAMEELTGHAAIAMSPASLTVAQLRSFIAAGDLVTMDTSSRSGLPFNLVGSHAYMVEGVTAVGGAPAVQLGNPWGFNQPAAIPFAQLSRGIVEVDVGRFA